MPKETMPPPRAEYSHIVVPHHFQKHTPAHQKHNPSNKRKSTRYTWWNFFPIALAIQFTKVVNLFYCGTAIMQCIPSIQTNSPAAVLVPLSFVISLGILKELIGELKRYKEDKTVNACPVIKMAPDGTLQKTTLADVAVGDIVRIEDREQVPADCVVLTTHGENHECFVKTAALDGERNLKPKLAVKHLSSKFAHLTKFPDSDHLPIVIESTPAMKDMYTYEGRITVNDGHDSNTYPLDMNQFLHRGSYLENSGHVYALVVHTGLESKLIMNLG